MDLHAQAGDFVGLLGVPALDDRDQEVHQRLVARGFAGHRVAGSAIERGGGVEGQCALRFDLGAHGHQHAAYVGVADDGHTGRVRATDGAALHAVAGVFHSLLVGTLGHRHAFDAHAQTGVVHHGEHIAQALVGLAHQVADGAAFVTEAHHGGGAAVDAQFVFQRHAAHVVTFPQAAVGIHQELGHDEQRDAFHARRGVGQTGQHQVDDVVRHVVLAPGNEDFLAADLVAAIAYRDGLAAYLGQVGARLRLGQVHGAGPLAGRHARQVDGFQFFGGVMIDGLDGPQRQHRRQRKCQVGRAPHFFCGQRHQRRQPLATELGRGTQAHPTGFHVLLPRFLEAFGGGDGKVRRPLGALVALFVDRGQHAFGELGAFFQNGVDQLDRAVFVAGQAAHGRQLGQLVQGKTDFLGGGLVDHEITPRLTRHRAKKPATDPADGKPALQAARISPDEPVHRFSCVAWHRSATPCFIDTAC